MTPPTAAERARALAEDIVRQWFSRSLGAMEGWEKWKPIWTAQLAEQFAAALTAARAEGLEEAAEKPGQHHIDDIGDCDTVSWIKGYLTCKKDFKAWCRAQAGKP